MRATVERYWVQLALIGVAIVWGSTFIMVKGAVAEYPLYAFLGLRFGIATVAFAALFPRAFKRFKPGTLKVGLLAGACLTVGYVFQTWGLQDTAASKAAFITGMFVVITPALQAVFLRRVPGWATMTGIALAVVGLWLLSGAGGGGWNVGDTRVLICAFGYAAHMIVLGAYGGDHDVTSLTLVQLATVGLVCGAISLTTENAGLPTEQSVWVALLVTSLLASAAAFAIQTYAQRTIPPARTALILITEPAFGGLFGWLAGEALGLRGLAGALCILGGMVLAEVVAMRLAGPEDHMVLEATLEGPSVPLVEE